MQCDNPCNRISLLDKIEVYGMINIGIARENSTFITTVIMATSVGKKPSDSPACGAKMSFANNWKGSTGTAWFIATLVITFAMQIT